MNEHNTVHAITIKLFNLYTCTQAYTRTCENNTQNTPVQHTITHLNLLYVRHRQKTKHAFYFLM